MGICASTKDKKEINEKKEIKEINEKKEIKEIKEENKLKSQKKPIEKPINDNKISSEGYTSRQEKTEKKSDGTIIKTIIEKKEGEIKTTTITTKGNVTETKTEIEKTEVTKTTKSTRKNHNTKNYEISNSNIDLSQNEFQKQSLELHNKLRKMHHVQPLKLNKELCKIAENYSKELAKRNSFEHSNNKYQGKNLGENLFMCQGKSINGYDMSQSWYDEINNYSFKNATFKSGTGHFTQLIWKNSTDVGFGYCKNNKGIYYGVANYFPAGNYMGQFKENVLPA